MTERVNTLLEFLKSKEYRKARKHLDSIEFLDFHDPLAHAENFRRVLAEETPVLWENDRFGFHRSTDLTLPSWYGNVTPGYDRILGSGFCHILSQIQERIQRAENPQKADFGKAMEEELNLAIFYAKEYALFAKKQGNDVLSCAICNVLERGARDFYEACVFLKLIIFSLRSSFTIHLTLGRFDQYMYPFYEASRQNGATDEEIFELLEEFFISLNFDTDLYPGIQQGDDGQSMVLGGYDSDGNDQYNPLSELCMRASLELCLIDPKINLRVSKNTPDERYIRATHLTKCGLGFPQYCNDDVVIKGLEKLGYDKEDAANYTVAACWEYIIPKKGADIPNYNSMDFPFIVQKAINENLFACTSFEALKQKVSEAIAAECDRIIAERVHSKQGPLPLLSVFFDGTIESLTDLFSGGTKYNNFGCHGVGIANGADILSAVKKVIYEDQSVEKETLLDALSKDFEGYPELLNTLLSCPKMGNDPSVDKEAAFLMDCFSKNLNGRPNGQGGIWRAGTGSAMDYLILGTKCPATADGRRAHACYPSSFSPSLETRPSGLLSVIRAFTSYDLSNIINGGPLTIEVHDTVLKNEIGIEKTALLVKEFIKLGGHQLQINSVNRDQLLDAQKHPENYPNLIVRVWGWSGYFTELDVGYQNHIIKRLEYQQ